MTRPPTRPAPTPAGMTTPPAAGGARRFSVSNIRRGLTPGPDRVLLYGIEGVGKSSMAADADAPVFLAAEDGVRNLSPVPDCVPEIRTWGDVLEALEMLRAEDHGYRTVVIDTLDWLDGLLRDEICRRNGWSVEEFGDALGAGGDGFEDGAAGGDVAEVADEFVLAGVVGLVADEEVGDLEDAGLVHLDGVAHAGGEDDDGAVDVLADARLVLAGADGFDEEGAVGG